MAGKAGERQRQHGLAAALRQIEQTLGLFDAGGKATDLDQDAAQFRPERWAAGHDVQPHDMRAYVQFGAGPRVCPGRHLAAVEIRLVLSMLARNFSMQLATDPAAVREVMAFTMMPSAMPVRLVQR